MLDVDGTVVPYDYTALPSDNVAKAIQNAQEKVEVCFVTGRSFFHAQPIFQKIGINTGYAVINNGAYVIDLETKKILYQQSINIKDVENIVRVIEKNKIPCYVKQDLQDTHYFDKPYKNGDSLKIASMIFTLDFYSSDIIDDVKKQLSHFTNVNVYKTKHKAGFGLNVQHILATKLHGIEIILKNLKLKSEDVIGVGDSYNDFPLLMACGLKVAMGNAVEDLKAIADYIAPNVDEDGVADVIEKFILNK